MKQTIRNKSSLINISVNFRETQLKMLKKLAMDKGVTLSGLIRKIIDIYSGERKEQLLLPPSPTLTGGQRPTGSQPEPVTEVSNSKKQ